MTLAKAKLRVRAKAMTLAKAKLRVTAKAMTHLLYRYHL